MSEAITLKKTIIAAAAAAMSGGVLAAELGSLMVFSAQGEPLEAELAVRDVAPADAVAVTLAEASVYQGVGERMVLGASDVNLVVQSRSPYKVRISSAKALDMVRFPLIVQLSESGRTSAKIYRVQLRPIPEAAAQTPSAAAASATDDAKRAAVPSAVPSAAQAPRASASAKVRETPKASVARSAERSASKTRAQSDAAALSEATVVKKGMTLWSIASNYRANYPKSVSTEQILVAFVRANPEAFERGRVSGLKVGSRLRAPTAAQVRAVPLDEAWALVRTARNADARVSPSESVLERARSSMRRRAPAQWRQLQSSRPTAAQSASKKSAEQKSASVKKDQTPATPKTEPAAAPEGKPAVSEPAATPKTDEAKAAQAANTESKPEPKAQAKPEAKPSQDAAQVKSSVDESLVESAPAPASETGSGSSGGWLGTILNLLVLIVAVGGISYYWFRRQSQHRQRREEDIGVVKFRRSKPAEPEQLQGAQEMLERRLQSERATERMQAAQSAQSAKPDAFERREPTLADVSSVQESKPAPTAFSEKTSDFWSKAASEPAQAPAADASLSPEVLSGKLITARSFLGVGAWDEAEALLREVQAKGNEQQRRQATELLNQVKKNAPGRQN